MSIGQSQLTKTPFATPSARKNGRQRSFRIPKIVFSTGTQCAWRSPVRAASCSAKTPQSEVPATKANARAGSLRMASSSSTCGAISTNAAEQTSASPMLTVLELPQGHGRVPPPAAWTVAPRCPG